MKTTTGINYLVDIIQNYVNLLGVDGIDLTQKQGYGTANLNANDESSIQVSIQIDLHISNKFIFKYVIYIMHCLLLIFLKQLTFDISVALHCQCASPAFIKPHHLVHISW